MAGSDTAVKYMFKDFPSIRGTILGVPTYLGVYFGVPLFKENAVQRGLHFGNKDRHNTAHIIDAFWSKHLISEERRLVTVCPKLSECNLTTTSINFEVFKACSKKCAFGEGSHNNSSFRIWEALA